MFNGKKLWVKSGLNSLWRTLIFFVVSNKDFRINTNVALPRHHTFMKGKNTYSFSNSHMCMSILLQMHLKSTLVGNEGIAVALK